MSIEMNKLAAALNAEAARQSFAIFWQQSGAAFGFITRPLIGSTVVEFDYDGPARLGEVPRWVCSVWRSGVAFDTQAENGRLAVIYCEAPTPSMCDEGALARLARFATGCVRLAPSVEIVAEGEAGNVKPE